MHRHPNLAPLSRHHHLALIAGRELGDLADGADTCRPVAQQFLEFWRGHGVHHFRIEEERLLPWFARYAAMDRPEIVRMLLEHADIRGRVGALEEALAAGDAPGAATLRDLGARLMAHVRLEEDVVFPAMEAALLPEQWQTLAALDDG